MPFDRGTDLSNSSYGFKISVFVEAPDSLVTLYRWESDEGTGKFHSFHFRSILTL